MVDHGLLDGSLDDEYLSKCVDEDRRMTGRAPIAANTSRRERWSFTLQREPGCREGLLDEDRLMSMVSSRSLARSR